MQQWAKERIYSHHRYAGFNLLLLSLKPNSSPSSGGLEYSSLLLTNYGAGGDIHVLDESKRGNANTEVEAQSNAVWPDKWEKASKAEDRMRMVTGSFEEGTAPVGEEEMAELVMSDVLECVLLTLSITAEVDISQQLETSLTTHRNALSAVQNDPRKTHLRRCKTPTVRDSGPHCHISAQGRQGDVHGERRVCI
jgi:hypothetical protein